MIDIETLTGVAKGAALVAGGLGVALSTAVIGAMVEAVVPNWGTRVWVGTCSALSVALRAFILVTLAVGAFLTLAVILMVAVGRWLPGLPGLVKGLCVTYLHLYRGGSGHRARGRGRRGAMGYHRAVA